MWAIVMGKFFDIESSSYCDRTMNVMYNNSFLECCRFDLEMRKMLIPNCKDNIYQVNNYIVDNKSRDFVSSSSGVTSFQSINGSFSSQSITGSKVYWNPTMFSTASKSSSKRAPAYQYKASVNLSSCSVDGGYFTSKLEPGTCDKVNKSFHRSFSDFEQLTLNRMKKMKNKLIEKDILIAELRSNIDRLRKRLNQNSVEREFYKCKCYFRSLRKHHRHSCKYALRFTSKRPIITWKSKKSLKN